MPNRCNFCAVNRIELQFVDCLPLKRQIKSLEMLDGERHDLVLLDNSVLASQQFDRIISICWIWGSRKARDSSDGCDASISINGTDVRLLAADKMRQLATIAIRPLRIAFDDSLLQTGLRAGDSPGG